MPKRLQRKRTKGWRKPAGSVIVDRTSRYGNPYRITGAVNAETSVAWFRSYVLDRLEREPGWLEPVLGKTHGVLLFQKDIMRLAVTVAGFS